MTSVCFKSSVVSLGVRCTGARCAGSELWGLGGHCQETLGPPASPDSRPLSKRPRLDEDTVPGHAAFVRAHYTVSAARLTVTTGVWEISQPCCSGGPSTVGKLRR